MEGSMGSVVPQSIFLSVGLSSVLPVGVLRGLDMLC